MPPPPPHTHTVCFLWLKLSHVLLQVIDRHNCRVISWWMGGHLSVQSDFECSQSFIGSTDFDYFILDMPCSRLAFWISTDLPCWVQPRQHSLHVARGSCLFATSTRVSLTIICADWHTTTLARRIDARPRFRYLFVSMYVRRHLFYICLKVCLNVCMKVCFDRMYVNT